MEAKVLAKQKLNPGGRSWYLCEANLYDYVSELKQEFYSFAIQRKIVKNIYLDKLFETIKSGDPIPVITFVSSKELDTKGVSFPFQINMDNLEILDGLQRTFRLWAFWILARHYRESVDLKDFTLEIKTKYNVLFETGVVSTRLIRELIDSNDISNIIKYYKDFKLYFIVWTKLSEDQVISKMLSLNAGQKSVSRVHQYELLFLHYYKKISDNNSGIKLVREKDENYYNIRKGIRDIGNFPFSSVIVALQSLMDKKPIRISIDKLVSNSEFDESPTELLIQNYFSEDFLECFTSSIYKFDVIINDLDKSNGKKWFVKDTTLSGFFAAIGKNMTITPDKNMQFLVEDFVHTATRLQEVIEKQGLDLEQFDKLYSEISGKSMNIGNFIRNVVYDYIDRLIVNRKASWMSSFEDNEFGVDND